VRALSGRLDGGRLEFLGPFGRLGLLGGDGLGWRKGKPEKGVSYATDA
jgi:hypothetical protein